MKTSPYMISRWIKACFLVILGVVILLYADKFVQDLRANAEGHFDVAFQWTWDLMTWLLWIVVLWLFVYAVVIVILSLTDQRVTTSDIMKKLEEIEKKLGERDTVVEDDLAEGEEEPPPPS